MIAFILSLTVYASGYYDLGNLDIKGQVELPSYKMQHNALDLQKILLKVSQSQIGNNHIRNTKLEKKIKDNMTLTSSQDFVFDTKVQKMRLD